MSIPITCPECRATDRVADALAGTDTACRKCGARVAVSARAARDDTGIQPPTAPRSGSARRSRYDDDDDDRSIAKRKKKGGNQGLLLLIGGGVLALSCLVCGGGGIGVGMLYWTNPPQKKVKDRIVAINDDMVFKDMIVKDGPRDFVKDGFKDIIKEGPKDFIKDGKGPVGPVGPIGPGGGKVILSQQGRLFPNDPIRDFKPHKPFPVRLEQGRTYTIDMISNEFDSYLRLYDPAGFKVAEDDDGGGFPHARIRYTPNQTGNFVIAATYFAGVNPQGANFTLTVRQE